MREDKDLGVRENNLLLTPKFYLKVPYAPKNFLNAFTQYSWSATLDITHMPSVWIMAEMAMNKITHTSAALLA